MKKVIILGCENSHANSFIKNFQSEKYNDKIKVVGVYSDDKEAAEKLHEEFGVYVMKDYTEDVGEIDGVIITARHGNNHLKYALPYFDKKVAMFIDKPITVREKDALTLAKMLKKYDVKFTGGSSCRFIDNVLKAKEAVSSKAEGKILGGFVRSPISLENQYGGYYFYSQHLVEIVLTVFGRFPKSVYAVDNNGSINVTFNYDGYSVNGLYVNENYEYYLMTTSEKGTENYSLEVNDICFGREADAFYEALSKKKSEGTVEELIYPVFVLNAILRSIKTKKTVKIKELKI